MTRQELVNDITILAEKTQRNRRNCCANEACVYCACDRRSLELRKRLLANLTPDETELETLRASLPDKKEMESAWRVLRRTYSVTKSRSPTLEDHVRTVDWLSRVEDAVKTSNERPKS